MPLTSLSGNQILSILRDESVCNRVVDSIVLKKLEGDIGPFIERLNHGQASWEDFEMFWPPRAVTACELGQMIPFFGAGVSVASGIALWGNLLQAFFEPTDALNSDEDLEHDF